MMYLKFSHNVLASVMYIFTSCKAVYARFTHSYDALRMPFVAHS